MKIMLIEDDETLNKILLKALKKEFNIIGFTSPSKAINIIEKDYYDVVISDIKMPEMNGLKVLSEIKRLSPATEVLLITGFGTIEESVRAVKQGAYDYILKPVDSDYLINKLNHIQNLKSLQKNQFIEINDLIIVCENQQMKNIIELAEKVAQTDTTVLIRGETGTGKEIISKFIHLKSHRQGNPFISINCANIQENLFESELFGFEKGSFTGADKNRRGFIELSKGGTLFLDEIAEMPLQIQSKFLRFMEERSFYKVGAEKPTSVDIRIIAATNKDLEDKVMKNEFRQDLYYRLNVFSIKIPSLKGRIEDIEALTNFFIKKFKSINPKIKGINQSCIDHLKKYPFPGNVRELSNLIERAMILEKGEYISSENLNHLQFHDKSPNPLMSMDELINDHIIRVLNAVKGDKAKASEILGIDRSTLYRRLKDFGYQ